MKTGIKKDAKLNSNVTQSLLGFIYLHQFEWKNGFTEFSCRVLIPANNEL